MSPQTTIMNRLRYWLWLGLLIPLPLLGDEPVSATEQVVSTWFKGVPLAPLLFVLAYILAQQLFISSVAFCVAGGALFGPIYGTLLNLTGATIGAALSFLNARHLLSDWVTPRLSPTLLKVRKEVEQGGWRAVFFIRLLPVLPFTPLNYTLGLTRLTLPQFLVPTFVCVAPRIAVYTYLGHTGRRMLEGNAALVWDVIVALGVLVAVSWLPHVYRKLRK